MNHKMLYGRTPIYYEAEAITESNILDCLRSVYPIYMKNRGEVGYLYRYYKGIQPIIYRIKAVRDEISNIVVENRAKEAVDFKTGYLFGEPVQYASTRSDAKVMEQVTALNTYMFAEGKSNRDRELGEWREICGTSFRMVLPDSREIDESPFEIYTLDPRYAFVVYSSGIGHKPIMGVYVTKKQNHLERLTCYTSDACYVIDGIDKISDGKALYLNGRIPIIEYPLDFAKLGSFETELSTLDAINILSSNRVDAVEQFVQAIMVFEGSDIRSADFDRVKTEGLAKIPEGTRLSYLTQELNQSQTQTFIDYLDQKFLERVGMPNRNGGTSTSDTGTAVIYRDGWQAAESIAKNSETVFKESEKQFLDVVFQIMGAMEIGDLRLSDIEIRFTRRNYENIAAKAAVLDLMLKNPMIHPKYAFMNCGMFPDGDLAFKESLDWYEAHKETGESQEGGAPHQNR
jgi:SPP1 family phage portal protein